MWTGSTAPIQGGLRLITCIAVNNELLASKSNPTSDFDDRSAIQTQVSGMKAFVEHVDKQAGGPGRGWLQIAYSPAEAQSHHCSKQTGRDPGG